MKKRRSQKPLKVAALETESLRSEQEDHEEPYRFLVQHAPYGIGILQKDLLMLANPMFARILGYRVPSDIEGKPILDFVEDSSRRSFQLLSHRRMRGEPIPSKFEIQMYRADDSLIDVESSLTLSLYHGNAAVSCSISDITERKELEKRLIDSERLFRNVVNSMVDALVITDLQGKVLDVNDGFEQLSGYSRREAFGMEIPYPWVSEEDLRSYISWLERLRENNYLRDFDVTWLRKDGRRISVSLSTTLLRNASGEPALMVNIARDISERQEAQHELALQFQRLQVLYELSRALTETWDLKEIAQKTYEQVKRVIPTDAFFINLYDEPKNSVRPIFVVDSHNAVEVVRDNYDTQFSLDEATACAKVIASRESILELRPADVASPRYMPFGDTKKPSVSLMFVPMFSKDRIIGILSVQSYVANAYSTDRLALLESISSVAAIAIEKVKLHQETIAKSQEIEARNKELDDFTYVVSHDLKEPLISVEGYAKILRQEYAIALDGTGMQFLRSILEACSHMKNLIEDLLQLSRVGRLAEVKRAVDLSWLISEVLEELRFIIQERKVNITVVEGLPSVVSVEAYLKIVFRNLISNAIKFCDKPTPVIEVGMQQGEQTVFFVKDNGIGIEQEYFDKIFMIFQRLHKREEYEGTGAGLTITKKIIEAHGGRIWVESTPGVGSTFFFTLPL
ncbi:MAG TPA: PAS domain S-box protein [Bacteroidota bacterium]